MGPGIGGQIKRCLQMLAGALVFAQLEKGCCQVELCLGLFNGQFRRLEIPGGKLQELDRLWQLLAIQLQASAF